MLALNTTPYHLTIARKFNVWYSVNNGNWGNPDTWYSNGKKRGHLYPQLGDDVYINHNVTAGDVYTASTIPSYAGERVIVVRNLYVNGTLNFKVSAGNIMLVVAGNLYAPGTIDMSANNINWQLYLLGEKNQFGSLITGTGSQIIYNRAGDQEIQTNVTYNILTLAAGANPYTADVMKGRQATKFVNGNLTANNTISIGDVCKLELGDYDLIANGQVSIAGNNTSYPATLSKTGSGNMIFIGRLSILNNPSVVDLTGNPTLEFRGGIAFKNDAITTNFGQGILNFTTNNQTLELSSDAGFYTPITNPIVNIVGAITVQSNANYIMWMGAINGTVSGSTLINNSHMVFASTAIQMSTGTFAYNNGPNTTIVYYINGDYTLPYTNYARLWIDGTGTKIPQAGTTWNYLTVGNKAVANFSLVENTSMSGDLTINGGTFECGAYDFTITGNTYVVSSSAKFSKAGSGALIFIGSCNIQRISANWSLTGNPTVELRGGLYMKRDGTYNWGTNTITFTTNNQMVQSDNVINPDDTHTFANNIVISGAITITYASAMWILVGTLDGTVSGSTFDCRGYLQLQNAQRPMNIGLFNTHNALNYVEYNAMANQDIQTGTYRNLTLAGSGSKKLLDDVTVLDAYILQPPATLDDNGFTLTYP